MSPKSLFTLTAAAIPLVERRGGGPTVESPSHEFDKVTSS
jgi:hypothetical protein